MFAGAASRIADAGAPIVFQNVTGELGLVEHLANWGLGHAGAWGDVTGNGRPDLYIGAFAQGPRWGERDALPNMLLLNEPEGFRLAPDETVRLQGLEARASHALFVDLNNDGMLDLLVGTHGRGPGSMIFENLGDGTFRQVPPKGDWPRDYHMRNATAIDLDQDGLLDLILLDGRYGGEQQRIVALRNLGDFQFEDVSGQFGFPPDRTRGLGMAVGDVNNDGRLDLFVAHSNRLFISQADGTYREHRPGFFTIPGLRGDNWPCGAAFADLTGNGLLDLVVTLHGRPAQLFLWVNRGIGADGMPDYVDATEESGLGVSFPREGKTGLMLKAAHLALVDLNNNGRRDILLSMVHEHEDGRMQPVVFRNTATRDGIPRFEGPPTDSILGYYATAPVADYDRDGRIDVFMATWLDELGSHLFRNVSEGGNFLTVAVRPRGDGLNTMGVGATVRLYEAGHGGDERHLLSRGDVALANGYSVGDEAIVHFGLGEIDRCDIHITLQGRQILLDGVAVNQNLVVKID
jgi:enediyne biosynthesis protein E4